MRKAYLFSAMAHEGVLRRDGQPYLSHPMNVANILADLKMDDTGIVAGFLHDVVEDNHAVSIEAIKKNFGEEVAGIVDAVTKIEKDIFSDESLTKEEVEVESLRKLILAMIDDIRVIFVKIADRLHNLRTMESMPPEKARKKAQECLQIFAPIANRLGLGKIKNELEDLAFKYAYPEDYEMIKIALQEKRSYSENFIEDIKKQIMELMTANGLKGEISGRVKHLYSIYNKILRQNITVNEVYDYMAFRILVPEERDCYAVMGLIHSKWNLIPGRLKDFISNPKENGYKSLHTSVIGPSGQPFEIQIRTYKMHEEAEEGIAAHWKYKDGKGIDEKDDYIIKFREEIKEIVSQSGSDLASNLNRDLHPKDIYVLTPQGKIIHLPRGSTPLDFAYHIHTEVGNHCAGAKIDGKMVPLKTELKSGQRVEIIKNPSVHPSHDWLDIAFTTRAKSKIKTWLAQNEKILAIERGKEVFERELRRFKKSTKDIEKDPDIQEGLKKAAVPDIDSLYAEIGYGKIDARAFLKRIYAEEEKEEVHIKQGATRKSFPVPVSLGGESDYLFNIAKCCNPVVGDQIKGYFTKGKGLVVHRATCSNIKRLSELFPERTANVSWNEESNENIFEIPLSITVKNRRGVLGDVTSLVSSANADIISCDAKSLEKQGMGEKGIIKLKIVVKNKSHFLKIIDKISQVEGVVSISRNAP
ncbi:MAG: bifunctional (p)ppGpp synthetase/guanosine-3',5'-bis(diphosphate) 3'-pyrophosphohydrolase [Acidobacteriota bacterium]